MGESFIRAIENSRLEDSGFYYTMSLINGKYKMVILYALSLYHVMRFNEMQRFIKTVTYKTLSATLKDLENDHLILRTEYPQVPPKVEYSLTPRGESLIPILHELCDWGEKNRL